MKTVTISLGTSEELATDPDPTEIPFNFIRIHRHPEPAIQAWGNYCSKVVTKLSNRSEQGLPVRWYHIKLFNFCYKQYDKYGDYYRLIDTSYGTYDQDGIYEVA